MEQVRRKKREVCLARAGLALATYLAVAILVGGTYRFWMPEENPAPAETMLTGLVSAVLIPLYLYLGRKWLPGHFACSHSRKAGWLLLGAAGTGAGLSLLYGWVSSLLRLSDRFSNLTQEAFYAAPLWEQVLVLCLLTPLCEELLFRGLIYGNLRGAFPARAAALVTSLLFTLFHGNVIQALYAFPMALCLQVFLQAGGGLEAPFVFHAAANLTAVLTEGILR